MTAPAAIGEPMHYADCHNPEIVETFESTSATVWRVAICRTCGAVSVDPVVKVNR